MSVFEFFWVFIIVVVTSLNFSSNLSPIMWERITVHIFKAMVLPVVMYGCESQTKKKSEHQRTDAFELVLEKCLRVPWTSGRSNQSILNEINSEYSLEGLILKLQNFGHLMQRTNSLEKPDAGKDGKRDKKRTAEDEIVR